MKITGIFGEAVRHRHGDSNQLFCQEVLRLCMAVTLLTSVSLTSQIWVLYVPTVVLLFRDKARGEIAGFHSHLSGTVSHATLIPNNADTLRKTLRECSLTKCSWARVEISFMQSSASQSRELHVLALSFYTHNPLTCYRWTCSQIPNRCFKHSATSVAPVPTCFVRVAAGIKLSINPQTLMKLTC